MPGISPKLPEENIIKPSNHKSTNHVAQTMKILRQKANERLQPQQDPDISHLGPEEVQRLIHELHVHQIELEIQNDELRRTQEALEVSQGRYIDLYDFAPVGYLSVSKKGLILKANLTAATLFGVARTEMIKQPLSKFILPEDQDIYYKHIKQLSTLHATASNLRNKPQSCELRMLRKNETAFWVQLSATLSTYSQDTPVFRIVLSDISRRKEAEEALRQSEIRERENRFQKLFLHHSAVMLILSKDREDR